MRDADPASAGADETAPWWSTSPGARAGTGPAGVSSRVMTSPVLAPSRVWTPSRVLVTRSAAERPHGQRVLARLEAAGVTAVELLRGDRLPNLRGDGDRAAFMAAKDTLALVVPPPSKRRLQPIAPSADFRLDLAVT